MYRRQFCKILFILLLFIPSISSGTTFVIPAAPPTITNSKTLNTSETGTVLTDGILEDNGTPVVTMQGGTLLTVDDGGTIQSANGLLLGTGVGTGTVTIENSGTITATATPVVVINFAASIAPISIINLPGAIFNSVTGALVRGPTAGTTPIMTIDNQATATFDMTFGSNITGDMLVLQNAGTFQIGAIFPTSFAQITNSGTFTTNQVILNTLQTSTINNTGTMTAVITANDTVGRPITKFNGGGPTARLEGNYNGTAGIFNEFNMNGNFVITASAFPATGNLSNIERVNLESGKLTVDNYTQSAAGILNLVLKSTTDFGNMDVTTTPDFAPGTTLKVTVPSNNTIADGDQFDIIVSSGGVTPLPTVADLTFDTSSVPAGITFTLTRPNDFLLRLLTSVQAVAAASGVHLAQAPIFIGLLPLAQTLDGICAGNPTGDMLTVCNGLKNLSPTDAAAAVQSIATDPNGAMALATLFQQGKIFFEVEKHLEQLRVAGMDSPLMGYAAGDMGIGNWGFRPFVFGNTQRQHEVQTIEGFRANTGGFGLLLDKQWCDTFTVGIGSTYGSTHLHQLSALENFTSIQSLQGLVYAGYDYCRFFVDGVVGIAENWYRNKHAMAAGTTISRIANSKHRGNQMTARARVGYNIPLCDTELTPMLIASRTSLRQTGYTENNAGALNQSIASRRDKAAQGSAGLRWTYLAACECIIPEIHGFYIRNFKNPNLQLTSTFTGGGAAFTTFAPNIPRDSYNAGLSFTAFVKQDISVALSYDLETRKQFTSHSGTLRFLWEF